MHHYNRQSQEEETASEPHNRVFVGITRQREQEEEEVVEEGAVMRRHPKRSVSAGVGVIFMII